MEKFINVKSGKEVKVGDLIKVVANVNIPVFGEIEAIKEITLTKDMLTKLILRGEVKIVKETSDPMKIWANAWKNLYNKVRVTSGDMLSILDALKGANHWAVVQLLLKEIAIELDKKYDNHIKNSEKIYAISPQDGRIHEVDKSHIKNYRAFPAFRNIEDAKIACSLVKNHLKSIFGDDKEKPKD